MLRQMVRALGPCKVLDLKLRRWASHRKVAGKTAAQRFFLGGKISRWSFQ